MNTTPESGQHLVVFVAAGDGSETACNAVARKLAEKFGAPYDRMQASVRQSPRVFKRNLNREQAESYADLLRSMGAVAEVQVNGSTAKPDVPLPGAPPEQEADSPQKPPPPKAINRSCPFCGRALLADGVCVICKPREVEPDPSPESSESVPPAAPDPALLAEEAAPVMEPAATLDSPQVVPTGDTAEELAAPAAVSDPGVEFEEPEPPATAGTVPADGGWAAPAPSADINGAAAVVPAEPGCANCGGLLDTGGQCPVCDLEAIANTAAEDSASIENDLSALLSPEQLGVCPDCCGPMEQDGTCLICPPAEPADIQAPTPAEPPEPAAPGPGDEVEPSPFEPLAPLGASLADAGADVCRGCGGPRGTDGTCLICGEGDADRTETPDTGQSPDVEEMTITGNEPPPAEPVTPAELAASAGNPLEPQEPTAPAAGSRKDARPAGKKRGVNPDLTSRPRALTIALLATVLLLAGGISMALTGSFMIASGLYFLALIAGLVTLFNAIRHFEQTVDRFPQLPTPVIIVFLCFLFLAGSGSILGYTFRQSASFLLDKAAEELRAEAGRPDGEDGLLPGANNTADGQGLSAAEAGGQIVMEEEMLERAIAAERKGEDNPQAALEYWRAYIEGFPDGTRSSEAKRKVSHWRSVVKREDALTAAIARDRKGNSEPAARINDWKSCLARYGNTPAIRTHAKERIAFWESMLHQNSTPSFPYWASLRLEDGRTFSGKVIAENDREMKMELPNRLKMSFRKGEYKLIDSDHINGKRVECENMQLISGVTTERPKWGSEDGITILGEDRAGVEAMVPFRVTGFYHFEVMARASKDHGGFPSVILSLNGAQQERIRFDSEEWKLYQVSFPFRIPAGKQRLEIVFPPQYQTMRDKRTVAIDYFTTAIIE